MKVSVILSATFCVSLIGCGSVPEFSNEQKVPQVTPDEPAVPFTPVGTRDEILFDRGNCPEDAVVLEGTAADDVLQADPNAPAGTRFCIYGGAGNDLIIGGPDDDLLLGGAGDDVIEAGGGNDLVDGEAGADTITGGEGSDIILGGSGNDDIEGIAGKNALMGGAGDDNIFGGDGQDVIDGGSGEDCSHGNGGDDVIKSSRDDFEVKGGDGVDTCLPLMADCEILGVACAVDADCGTGQACSDAAICMEKTLN